MHASGLYGWLSAKVELEPVTLLCGPNGSGKSSILGLPSLVLDGPSGPTYPLLGASPAYDWAAGLTFDDSRPLAVTRWMRGGEHKLALNREAGKLGEVGTRIAQRVGASASWKLDALLSMTPQRRQDWLVGEAVLSADLDSKERVQAFWARLDAAGLADDVRDVRGTGNKAGVNTVLSELRALAAEANREALDLRGGDEQDEADLPPGSVASWRARVAEIDRASALLIEERGRRTGHGLARADLEAAERAVLADLEKIQAAGHGDRCAHADARVAETAAILDRLIEAETAAGRAHADQVAMERPAYDALRAAEQELARAREEANTIEEVDPDTAEEGAHFFVVWRNNGMFMSVQNGPYARHCKGSLDEITMRAIFPLAAAPALLPRLMRALRAGVPPVLTAERAAEELVVAENEAATAALKHQAAQRLERRLRDARDAAATAAAAGRVAATRAQDAEAEARRARTEADVREQQLHQRLEEVRGQLGMLLDGAEEEIRAQLDALDAERAEAQRFADRLSDVAARTAARLDREARRAAEVQRRTRARALITAIEGIRGKLLLEATGPLEEPASEITRRVIGADIRVVLDKGASFQLHFPGHVAPIRASRSEAAVAAVALRCAIVNKLGGYRMVALDDMENLEGPRRGLLLDAMSAEVAAGRLDTFLGAYVSDGWVPDVHARPPGLGFIDTRDNTVVRR